MGVTRPCEFVGFGVMEVTKSFKFVGFGAMEVTKPYRFIGFGAVLVGSTLGFGGSFQVQFLRGGSTPPATLRMVDVLSSYLLCVMISSTNFIRPSKIVIRFNKSILDLSETLQS